MLDGKQENVGRQTAAAKFRAIGVAFPSDAAEQRAVAQTERDQIAAATVIGPENQLARF